MHSISITILFLVFLNFGFDNSVCTEDGDFKAAQAGDILDDVPYDDDERQLVSNVDETLNKISVNLLNATLRELEFLSEFVAKPAFYEEKLLENAARRYENCWLPLQAANPALKIVPPVDVELIWHAHMLSPTAYREDCELLVGTVVDHQPLSPEEKEHLFPNSLVAWNQFCPEEPYIFNMENANKDNDIETLYQRKIGYDVVEAAKRQRRFAENLLSSALPTTMDLWEFAVVRYIHFLQLIQTYPERRGFVPTVDIDLVWHSHQQQPKAYNQDCLSLFGRLINHNDLVSEKSLESGATMTEQLWDHHFPHEPYLPENEDYDENVENEVEKGEERVDLVSNAGLFNFGFSPIGTVSSGGARIKVCATMCGFCRG